MGGKDIPQPQPYLVTPDGREVDRRDHLRSLVLVESSVLGGVRDYFGETGSQDVSVSQIVGITGACEQAHTMYGVTSRDNRIRYVPQTGQLSLEQYLIDFKDVWTVMQSGRDEELEDVRHLKLLRLIEREKNCVAAGMELDSYDEEVMFEDMLWDIERATKAMIGGGLEQREVLEQVYGRSTAELEEVLKRPYLRTTYEDALRLLNDNGYDLTWGA